MAKNKRRGRTISVDMEGVESGGRTIPDGTYLAEIVSVEEKESSEGNPMLALKWKTKGKKNAGVTIFDNISLLPQALWRLKGLLEALGQEVPDSSMEVALDDLEGAECNIVITNEEYEGKKRPKVTEYTSTEDEEEDERDGDEDDNGDSDEDEDEEEDSRPGRKPQGKARKADKKPRRGSKPKDEDEDEDEDDEDDEDEDEDENRPRAGQKVKWKDEKGKSVKGKITAIEDDTATVKDSDGDEWEIDLSELTVIS